jgi:Flp pilus assembly protein TadD
MSTSLVPYNMYEAQNAYQRLRATLSSDSVEAAIAEVKTFLKMFPDVALAHNDLGVLFYKAGNSLLALAHYEKANRLQPDNPLIIKNLAEFYFVALEWTDDAIEMLTGLLNAYPQDFEVLTALGNISNRVGRSEEARTFYRQALQIDPESRELRELLARLEGPVSAAEYRSVTTSPSPTTPPAAGISKPVDEDDEAASSLQRLLAQNPGNAVAHNNLGIVRFEQGRFDEAVTHYEQAVACDSANPVYRKNLADLYYTKLGRSDEAIEIYTNLLKQHPKDIELLSALAIIAKNNHLKEQARTFIKQVLELEPWNSDAREFLADL